MTNNTMNSLTLKGKATVSQRGSPCFSKGIHLLRMLCVYTSTRREGIRKERILLYRKSKSRFFKDRQRVKEISQQDNGKWSFNEKGIRSVSHSQRAVVSKSVWKSFTSTFMRDGAKLRYQSMLRKALLFLQ